MARVLISGLINIETTLRVDRFPLPYYPVTYPFGGVASSVSGVGLNIARALRVLGHEVRLVSMIGADAPGRWVRDQLARWNIADDYVIDTLPATPQSVILYDAEGRRQIHVDLKTIQDVAYPDPSRKDLWDGVDLAVLCNINYSRGLIPPTRARGIPWASDVHALEQVEDAYNREFTGADILFMSHERLPESPEAFGSALRRERNPEVLVIGCGAEGAWLFPRGGTPTHVPAVRTRPIINTIGAGDALFSGFLHGWLDGLDHETALRQAIGFASWKIGCASASHGFLDAETLAALYRGQTIPPNAGT